MSNITTRFKYELPPLQKIEELIRQAQAGEKPSAQEIFTLIVMIDRQDGEAGFPYTQKLVEYLCALSQIPFDMKPIEKPPVYNWTRQY